MKKFLEFVGILGLVFGLGLKAEVSNIYVPSQYQTIQKAIKVVSNVDTIRVSAGTYKERMTINKRIGLIGVGMPTIDPSGD